MRAFKGTMEIVGKDSPPWLRRGAAARRERDSAKHQEKRRRGGWFKKLIELEQTTPALRATPPQLRRGVLLTVALILIICFAGAPLAQAQITITTSSLPGGVVGSQYPPQVLSATGGNPPYTWCWEQVLVPPTHPCADFTPSGSRPPGLSLSTDGVISGTPTQAGTFNFVVRAKDSSLPTAQTGQKSLTIVITDPLVITTTTLPQGQVSTAYPPTSLTASGGTSPYSWSIISGILPPGLTLSSSGVISGTPTVSGRFNFTVRATDSSNPQQSTTKALSIAVPPTITTASLPNGAVGLAYGPVTLTASPGTTTYTWAATSGLPGGLTLSSDGVLNGTPAAAGTFNTTFTVTDGSTPALSATKVLPITIQPVLAITTASPLPPGMVGVFYSRQLETSGPSGAQWSVVGGNVPPGTALGLNGTLSGTPTTNGTFDFTVQAQGGDPRQTTTKAFQVVINRALTMSTTSLPDATVSSPYTFNLAATGGQPPYIWTSQGNLPPGLALSNSGVLSGTPSAVGTYSFTVIVSDSFTPKQEVSRSFTITVTNKLAISTASLPTGAVSTRYGPVTLNATAGTPPYSWTVSNESLPSGLSLSSDGIITGTPAVPGTFTVTFNVQDNSSPPLSVSKNLPITIQPSITITSSENLPLGVVGAFYSRQIEASGPSPLTWSVIAGSPPPGVTLSSTGTLSGTPTAPGSFSLTVQALHTDPRQTATQVVRVVINPALTITTAPALPDASPGVPYSASLAATGGVQPYTWTALGRLPTGLSLSSNGVISGTPTSLGTINFAVQVSDSFSPKQDANRTFTVTITSSLTIVETTLPNAIQNVAYSRQFQPLGGTAPFSWTLTGGALPVGMTLSTAGLFQGTPTEAGTSTFTVTVTDLRGTTGTRQFTFVVDPPISSFMVSTLPATLNPTQPAEVQLSLAQPHPSPLAGKLMLSFTPKAEVPGDDQMTQFSTGSRTVNFTIPAGMTAAVFPSTVTVLTGTVTGTVRLTANIDNGPSDLPVSTVEIASTPPQMTNVSAARTGGGLEVHITGYAPSRRITNVEFTFEVKVGTSIERVTLQRSVEVDFNNWYRNPASTAFGSAFSFVQSFAIQGADSNAIESVTVRLTNAQGSATSAVIRPQ